MVSSHYFNYFLKLWRLYQHVETLAANVKMGNACLYSSTYVATNSKYVVKKKNHFFYVPGTLKIHIIIS